MEIHQHTHTAPASGGTGRKKWTHYFWEFFMLFLAVTLGFFVENQREHYVEHKREKNYAVLMLKDLNEDTFLLNILVPRYTLAAAYIDTFINIIGENELRQVPGGELYWYGLWGGYLTPFTSNNVTFEQMKYSGSLRYIRNRELSYKIALYDWQVRKIGSIIEKDQPIYTETRKTRSLIFDFKYNKSANQIVQAMYLSMSDSLMPFDYKKIDSFTARNLPLLSYDKSLLNQYAEMCRSRSLGVLAINFNLALMLAKEIIVDLKNEYHLK